MYKTTKSSLVKNSRRISINRVKRQEWFTCLLSFLMAIYLSGFTIAMLLTKHIETCVHLSGLRKLVVYGRTQVCVKAKTQQ